MALFSTKSQAPPAAPQKPEKPAPAAQTNGEKIQLSPEEARKQAEAAEQRAAAFGRITAMMSVSPRHNKLTLRELNNFFTPAVALGQFAMVGAQPQQGGPAALAAAVWWALVSPEVDKRLSESSSEFLHIEGQEWKSGDQPWIIDAVGDQRIVGELLKQLSERTFKNKPAKLRGMTPDGRIAVGRLEAKPPA